MANKRLLAALLVAAAILGCVAIETFLRPCQFPPGYGDCSASPSLVPGATDPGFFFFFFCLPVSIYAVWGVQFLVGVLIGMGTVVSLGFLFADDIMEAGYFTIRGDPEAGGKIQ